MKSDPDCFGQMIVGGAPRRHDEKQFGLGGKATQNAAVRLERAQEPQAEPIMQGCCSPRYTTCSLG